MRTSDELDSLIGQIIIIFNRLFMGTYGVIYLPENPLDPQSKVFNCPVDSDGYLTGIGYGILSSSSQIESVCKLSSLFVGSAIFYKPCLSQFETLRGRDIVGDIMPSYHPSDNLEKTDYEKIVSSAETAFKQMHKGQIAEALTGEFSQWSLDQKISLGLGAPLGVRLREANAAWDEFIAPYDKEDSVFIYTSGESAHILAELESARVLNNTDLRFSCSSYFWCDGQFWTKCQQFLSDGRRAYHVQPLIHVAALARSLGCYGDLSGYLGEITAKDQQSLSDLLMALEEKKVSLTGLFNGHCDDPILAFKEKAILEANTPSAQSGTSSAKNLSL